MNLFGARGSLMARVFSLRRPVILRLQFVYWIKKFKADTVLLQEQVLFNDEGKHREETPRPLRLYVFADELGRLS